MTLFLAGMVGEQVHEPSAARFGRLSEAIVELLTSGGHAEKRTADSQ